MNDENELRELQKLISQCTKAVVYKPYNKEVDYDTAEFSLKISSDVIYIPNNKHTNPFEWAEKCIEECEEHRVCILIPGTCFDMYGTRHGKGAGWYDRFLSKVPRGWIRVGICKQAQMSSSKLVRQKWDQPMDWIVIKEESNWKIHKINHPAISWWGGIWNKLPRRQR